MSEKSKLWHLENFNLFKDLCGKEMHDLNQNTVMKTAKKNQFIYFPDEPSTTIFLLKEGEIKLGVYSDDGKEQIKTIVKAGEVFGELGLAGEETREDFAQAITDDVTICALSMADMEGMMEKNSKLSLRLTKFIGLRLRKTERKLNDLIFKDVRTRVIEFLIQLSKDIGTKVGDETLIKHNFTHQDIANLTATTRQTVTTILNDLKEKNLIYTERKRILIRDISKLG